MAWADPDAPVQCSKSLLSFTENLRISYPKPTTLAMDDHATRCLQSTEKGTPMTGRLLEFPVRRPFSGVIEINGFCDSTRTFAPRHLPFKCEMNRASRASAMGLGCVRGTTLG